MKVKQLQGLLSKCRKDSLIVFRGIEGDIEIESIVLDTPISGYTRNAVILGDRKMRASMVGELIIRPERR